MNAYVLTISDSGAAGKRVDTAGPAVCKILTNAGYKVAGNDILADDYSSIVRRLTELTDDNYNLIITTGGTGFSKRDITPEATEAVITRKTPGLNEYMRMQSAQIANRAMLSRATSGIKDNSLIINLPGSEKAASENLQFILPLLKHGIDILTGADSNCGVPINNNSTTE